ncbi:MAG: GxxExxY protein [Planctomycetes bacterium]|nr:GxxExxY protein [Planctomycetota bacterium]
MEPELKYADLTGKIRDCAYRVYRELGCGFLEKVYENSLAVELEMQNIQYDQQKPVTVSYRDRIVGQYVADMLVEDKVIVELKAAKEVGDIHFTQLFNYLKATGCEVGLLINFGPRFTFKRRIYNNQSASSVSSVVNNER